MAKLNFSIALGLAAQNFQSGLSKAQQQLKGFASSVKSAFGMIAGAFAAGQIKAFSQECLNAYSAQIQAEQKLSVIMKQRMNATDQEVKSILKLTSAQQQQGIIGDEVQIAGAQQVATFLKQKSSLDALIPAMNNLLAQQKGVNATQGDAVTIGNLMGKVMQGQTSALKRVGITFDEAQEKVLKYGTESERAAMLAQVITDNVGNMNSELAKTDIGKIQQMNNTLGDLKEQIGGAIAPIVGQLAPSLTNIAVSMANGVTNAINVIKTNIQEIVGFIAMQLAGLGIVKLVQSIIAQVKVATTSIKAEAIKASTALEVIDNKILSKKVQIENMKLQAAKKGLTEESAFYEKIKNQEAALAQLTADREKAAAAEAAAQEKLAAYESGNAWQKGMFVAKMATRGFMLAVKTAFRSFAPLLIFEALFTVGMKVYDMLMKNSGGFRALAKIVGGAVFNAISALATALGTVFDWLADILGLSDKGSKGGKKKIKASDGTEWDTVKQARQHNYDLKHPDEKKKRDAKLKADKDGGTTDTKKGKKTTTTTTKAPAQKAAEDVANAEKSYAEAVKKIQTNEELGYTKAEDARADLLSAMRSEYDAYSQAYVETGNKKYYDAMKKLLPQIEALDTSVEAEKEANDEVKRQEEDRAKTLAELAKIKAEKRDNTFDYKLDKEDKENINIGKNKSAMRVDVEFDIEKNQKQIEELKNSALAQTEEVKAKIKELENENISLQMSLDLHDLNKQIDALQKDLSEKKWDLALGSWQNLENAVDSVSDCIDDLSDPDASGWEKFCSVINTAVSLLQTYKSIAELINGVTTASKAVKDAETQSLNANTTAQALNSETTSANTAAQTTNTVAQTANEAITAVDATTTTADTVATAANTASTGVNTATTTTNTSASIANTSAKSGEAIANATASGAKLPFPANLAAIAAGIAAVVGALTMVKSFSTGGIVKGSSLHGDFIPAMLNSQEAVLNPTQQSRFMKIANGGSVNGGGLASILKDVRFHITGDNLEGTFVNHNSKKSKIR